MLNTMMENENNFFPEIMFAALKYPLLKLQLKSLEIVRYPCNIYTNQLKLKVKISKVIMEGNV